MYDLLKFPQTVAHLTLMIPFAKTMLLLLCSSSTGCPLLCLEGSSLFRGILYVTLYVYAYVYVCQYVYLFYINIDRAIISVYIRMTCPPLP